MGLDRKILSDSIISIRVAVNISEIRGAIKRSGSLPQYEWQCRRSTLRWQLPNEALRPVKYACLQRLGKIRLSNASQINLAIALRGNCGKTEQTEYFVDRHRLTAGRSFEWLRLSPPDHPAYRPFCD